MKKLLLGLGTITAVAAPVAAVVACGSDHNSFEYESTHGDKATLKYHDEGYAVSASFTWYASTPSFGYGQQSDQVSPKFLKDDIDKWSKLDKIDFILKYTQSQVTPEFRQEVIGAVNDDSAIFKSEAVEDVFTASVKRPDGVLMENVLGTGQETLTSLSNIALDADVSESTIQGMKNFITKRDPELKDISRVIYISSSMSKDEVLAAVKPITDINDVMDEIDRKVSDPMDARLSKSEALWRNFNHPKFLLIYDGNSEIEDMSKIITGTAYSRYQTSSLSSFQEDVNRAIGYIKDIPDTFKLFRNTITP